MADPTVFVTPVQPHLLFGALVLTFVIVMALLCDPVPVLVATLAMLAMFAMAFPEPFLAFMPSVTFASRQPHRHPPRYHNPPTPASAPCHPHPPTTPAPTPAPAPCAPAPCHPVPAPCVPAPCHPTQHYYSCHPAPEKKPEPEKKAEKPAPPVCKLHPPKPPTPPVEEGCDCSECRELLIKNRANELYLAKLEKKREETRKRKQEEETNKKLEEGMKLKIEAEAQKKFKEAEKKRLEEEAKKNAEAAKNREEEDKKKKRKERRAKRRAEEALAKGEWKLGPHPAPIGHHGAAGVVLKPYGSASPAPCPPPMPCPPQPCTPPRPDPSPPEQLPFLSGDKKIKYSIWVDNESGMVKYRGEEV